MAINVTSSANRGRSIEKTDSVVAFDHANESDTAGVATDTVEEFSKLIPQVDVDTALPDSADFDKNRQYATSAATDEGLTSPAYIVREGHTSIVTLRSDYLGNDREGYARYTYGPRPEERYEANGYHGGDIEGGDPSGLIGVVIEYTSGLVTKIFLEGQTDGDGVFATFVADNATSNIKLRYRPKGTLVWTNTLTLDDTSTPRTNVKQWSKDDDLGALVPPPLSMQHHGAGATEARWEFEILNADDDVALEVGNATYLDGLDTATVNEEFADYWKRSIEYVADQIGKKIVDVTGRGHPHLDENNYKALFVDWSVPRLWIGRQNRHNGTDPVGTFTAWSHSRFLEEHATNPVGGSANLTNVYYNTTHLHWKIVEEQTGIFSSSSYPWVNVNIEHVAGLNIEWLGDRSGPTEALRHITAGGLVTGRFYLFYNTSSGDVENLTHSTYTEGVTDYTSYELLSLFSPTNPAESYAPVKKLYDSGTTLFRYFHCTQFLWVKILLLNQLYVCRSRIH